MADRWSPVGGEKVSLEAMPDAARELLERGADLKVWLLHGELGAGKTTLVNSLVRHLGINDHVSSPTYSIINQYVSGQQTVYHFDFYRLKHETEAYDIGVEEYFDSGNLCLVEWPERIPSFIPPHYFEVRIEPVDVTGRKIYYSRHD